MLFKNHYPTPARGSSSCAKRKRRGFTLVEVMFSFAMVTIITVASMYTSSSLVHQNNVTTYQMAASNAISGQLNVILAKYAFNKDNMITAGNVAKNVIYSLNEAAADFNDKFNSKPDSRYKLGFDAEIGAIVYEFPVPNPGRRNSDVVEQGQNYIGSGVIVFFLDENKMQNSMYANSFYSWSDLHQSGGSETATPNALGFFDMDNDGIKSGDFTALYDGTHADFGALNLMNLPMFVNVRYYASANHLRDALNTDNSPGFRNDSNSALIVNLERFFVVNDGGITPLDGVAEVG